MVNKLSGLEELKKVNLIRNGQTVCTNSFRWDEMLLKVPSSADELQESLRRYHIALMASSPPGQSIQKYFFYAQQVNHINHGDLTY